MPAREENDVVSVLGFLLEIHKILREEGITNADLRQIISNPILRRTIKRVLKDEGPVIGEMLVGAPDLDKMILVAHKRGITFSLGISALGPANSLYYFIEELGRLKLPIIVENPEKNRVVVLLQR